MSLTEKHHLSHMRTNLSQQVLSAAAVLPAGVCFVNTRLVHVMNIPSFYLFSRDLIFAIFKRSRNKTRENVFPMFLTYFLAKSRKFNVPRNMAVPFSRN